MRSGLICVKAANQGRRHSGNKTKSRVMVGKAFVSDLAFRLIPFR